MDKHLHWELPLRRHPPLLKQHPLRELQRLQGLPPLLELLLRQPPQRSKKRQLRVMWLLALPRRCQPVLEGQTLSRQPPLLE